MQPNPAHRAPDALDRLRRDHDRLRQGDSGGPESNADIDCVRWRTVSTCGAHHTGAWLGRAWLRWLRAAFQMPLNLGAAEQPVKASRWHKPKTC
jgi:hypothetical protein